MLNPDAFPTQTEAQFQQRVLDYAHLNAWRSYHTYRSDRSQPGFPDLVLVRERVVFAELKTETGKVTTFQDEWLMALSYAKAEVYIWRPSSWPLIEQVLAKIRR